MDERTEVSAAFALRLSADLITALVVTGVLSKAKATTLVDDAVSEMAASHPSHAHTVQQIGATLISQVSLASADVEARMKKS